MGDRAEGAEASMEAAIAFERAHAHITRSEGNAVATVTEEDGYVDVSYLTAASGAVLKGGGVHMVQFTVRKGEGIKFGLIGAYWGVEGGSWAQNVQGHSFYSTFNGTRYPHDSRYWEGMQSAREGDRIGLLLDLDQGTMTVYKNDERLGVMATGLSGEYCWAVSMYGQEDSVRIAAAAAPASPTPEQLARAVAYEAELAG